MKRLLVLVLLTAAACGSHQVMLTEQAPATWVREPGGYEEAIVVDVIDGDTLEVEVTGFAAGPGAGAARVGERYTVRLIGIDTPESVKPNSPVECFGRESSAAAEALLAGAQVRLVKDVEEADQYGRLLRYVYLGDETANGRMVVNGYANAYTYPPNVRHSTLFLQLEREARENDRGLWSSDTCDGEA